MKKLIKLSFLVLCMSAFTACSVDTHYDSVSTYIEINVTENSLTGETIPIYQRFQFDRDLVPLESMSLESAWISAPDLVDAPYNDSSEPFELNVLRDFSIQLVNPGEEESTTKWLSIFHPTELKGNDFQLHQFGVSDLRTYLNEYQQLELQIKVDVEPYHLARYWRDVCHFSENCTMKIPLSMHFKMED